MSHLQEPLTLPTHPALLHKINELSIAIKLYYIVKGETPIDNFNIGKAQANHEKPSWDNVVEILRECYNAINEQRKDPRKY